ncbi:MAG: DUF6879 family protein [Actinomycetota bacterium]
MRAAGAPLADEQWVGLLRAANTSAWRLEQQPSYVFDTESGWPERWHAGDRTRPDYIAEWSAEFIRPYVERGGSIIRVRVVDDPMTPTQQWADWAAEANRAAGEQIELMPRRMAEDLGIVDNPLIDWWLIDGTTLLLMTHNTDGLLLEVRLGDETAVARTHEIWRIATEAIDNR